MKRFDGLTFTLWLTFFVYFCFVANTIFASFGYIKYGGDYVLLGLEALSLLVAFVFSVLVIKHPNSPV